MALYGVIDPNAAVATAATVATSQSLSTIAKSNETKIRNAALGDPDTTDKWYVKSTNNDGVRAMAASTGPDMVLGEEGQKRILAQAEYVEASQQAISAVVQDAAQSVVRTEALAQASQQTTESSARSRQGR